jgi:hypothetical protein
VSDSRRANAVLCVECQGQLLMEWAVMKGGEGRRLVDGRLEEWLAHCL